eukprot:scaffold7349_cov145-Skeletonema_menzelii.AAC.12
MVAEATNGCEAAGMEVVKSSWSGSCRLWALRKTILMVCGQLSDRKMAIKAMEYPCQRGTSRR